MTYCKPKLRIDWNCGVGTHDLWQEKKPLFPAQKYRFQNQLQWRILQHPCFWVVEKVNKHFHCFVHQSKLLKFSLYLKIICKRKWNYSTDRRRQHFLIHFAYDNVVSNYSWYGNLSFSSHSKTNNIRGLNWRSPTTYGRVLPVNTIWRNKI